MTKKLLLVASLVLAACGGGDGPAVSVTCTFPDMGTCTTAVSKKSNATTTLDADCTSAGGVLVDGCPTANLVGTCSNIKSSDGTETIYSYSPASDDSTALANCATFDGTFSP